MIHMDYNLHGFLNSFFRQIWIFLLLFGLCAAAGAYYIYKTPAFYEARGSFVVKFGENARPDISVSRGTPREFSYSDRSELMQSYIQILRSHNLLRTAVREMGPGKLYPFLTDNTDTQKDPVETAVRILLGGDVRIEAALRSNIIEVYVKNQNPEAAAQFTEILMREFIPKQTRIYESSQKDFLDKQIRDIEQRYEQAQLDFLNFKNQAGVSEIDIEMEQLISEKSALSAIAFEALTQAQASLSEAEAQAAQARSTYRPDSDVMRRLNKKIGVARAELETRKADLAATEETGGPLAEKIKTIDARIAHLEAQRGQFNELEKRVEMEESNLEYYQQRAEEARVNAMLNQENITRISVLDNPAVPVSPGGPNKKMILLAALFAGAFLGLGGVVAREVTDDSFSTPDQLQHFLSVPVLATFNKKEGGA